MFTGIVAAVGRIVTVRPAEGGARLCIEAGELPLGDVAPGDSIAVNGVCLTAVVLRGDAFEVDVSRATLDCTTGFNAGARVNLEKALRLADRLGGHIVSGHVDGVGDVIGFEALGDNRLLRISVPPAVAKYLARKGSVAVNGVSLTVNEVSGTDFSVNLIPHTLGATNLGELRVGDRVNLEADQIARYLERLQQFGGA